MMRELLAMTILVGVALPARTSAMVLPDTLGVACEATTLVSMPCASHPAQLQTLRLALVKSLMPMDCQTVAVRLRVGRYAVTPTRLAGAVASVIFRRSSRNAQLQEACRPQSGW